MVNRFFYWLVLIVLLGCKSEPLPDPDTATKTIRAQVIENGQMPGGNPIDIHRFDVEKIEKGSSPNTAIVFFQIDFTRYPTSGLAPEYQTDKPMRQTEDHQAILIWEKEKWTVQNISLR